MVLNDGHTGAEHDSVWYTEPMPGVPILLAGNGFMGDAGHFGAGLSPLPDSSLLVYKAVDPHPLGIVPGDIVLGYDGTPWKELYRFLIDAGLPFTGAGYHGSETSRTYAFLVGAGMNWHLFDTIDIVKHETGDTVHLPTSLLIGQDMTLYASDQMDVPGIPLPNISDSQIVTYGVIDGTSIGYIYSSGFFTSDAQTQFTNAIYNIMNNYQTTGLIVDFRANPGGWINHEQQGLELLFGNDTALLWFDRRCDPDDHFVMCPTDRWVRDHWTIYGNNGFEYDKPIAVLTGPATTSMGEFASLQLSFHPMAKCFGLPTMGAINIPEWPQPTLYPGFFFNYAENDTYFETDSGNYISRPLFPSAEDYPWLNYEEVWLTQEGVIEGRDDVVEAALDWILSRDIDQDGVVNENDNCPELANSDQYDVDSDGVGDVCDNCPEDYNPGQEDICSVPCGDMNETITINILDITYLISYLYKGGPEPESMWAADVNGDGNVNILDVTYLISYLYKGGPAPDCV